MANYKTLGELIKCERKKLALTQKELALKVGCTEVSICNWELNNLKPSGSNCKKLAFAFKMPITEITKYLF